MSKITKAIAVLGVVAGLGVAAMPLSSYAATEADATVQAEIKTALSQADFVKEMITAVVKGFNAGGAEDIELLLPESLGAQLVPFIEKGLKESVGGEISVKLSKKTQGGFTIAPKDGGYYISFTEETFKELIGGYLRPATKKILFG